MLYVSLLGPLKCCCFCAALEQVPLDGITVWGTSNVSLQHISGESAPVRMSVGSQVPAGVRRPGDEMIPCALLAAL